jgi:hypothetical protein
VGVVATSHPLCRPAPKMHEQGPPPPAPGATAPPDVPSPVPSSR